MTSTSVGDRPRGASAQVTEQAYSKVTRHIMPLAFIAFFITYVDRANLGIVATAMGKDIHLTPTTFGLAAGMFYVGYLIAEVPSNILLEKVGGRKWFSRILASFGIISGLTAFVWNDISLMAIRILLGIGEAGLYPGMLLFLGYWFNGERRGSKWLIFQMALPFSLAVGALVSAGLLGLDGLLGVAGWRWVFIIEAILTTLVAALIYFKLPDTPSEAKWLNAEEVAVIEAESDIAKTRDVHGWSALLTVAKSPVAWYVMFIYFCSLVGFLTVQYWAPQLIGQKFHLSGAAAGFLSALPWVVSLLGLYAASRFMAKRSNPTAVIVTSMTICGVGMTIASLAENPVFALIGLCLAAVQQAVVTSSYMFIQAHFPLALSAVAFAFVNSLANISGLIGPWMLGVIIEATGSAQVGLLTLSAFFWVSGIMAIFAPAFIRSVERRQAVRGVLVKQTV